MCERSKRVAKRCRGNRKTLATYEFMRREPSNWMLRKCKSPPQLIMGLGTLRID